MKDALLKAKNETTEELYIRTDSHWNSLGAFYGYKKIVDVLNKDFNYDFYKDKRRYYRSDYVGRKGGFGRMISVFSPPRSDIHLLRDKKKDRAMYRARRQRSHRVRKQNDHTLPLIIKRTPQEVLCNSDCDKTALVYRNSFFKKMLPFFSKHFTESIYYSHHRNKFSLEDIKKHKPDLVIEQYTDFEFY